MIWLVASLLLLLSWPAHATTYWVSDTGGVAGIFANCASVSGSSDPGVYMTRANMDSANCGFPGDTIMLKAETYTGSHVSFEQFFSTPSGTSTSNRSKVLCETHRGCVMKTSAGGFLAVIEARNVSYFQIGDTSHGFIADCANGGSSCMGIKFGLTVNAVFSDNVIQGNYVRNHHGNGINNTENQETGGYYVRFTWSYNEVEAQALPSTAGPPHPIYLAARDSLVEHNIAHTLATASTYAFHCYHICTGNIFRYNYAEVNPGARAMVMSDSETALDGNNQAYGNVFKGFSADMCFDDLGQSDTNTIVNNTCDGFTTFIRNQSGATNNIFKNNLCSGTCTITQTTVLVCGGTCSTVNPTVTAATHYKDPTNGDYSLKAGSAQIDAGVNVGLPYNGSAPDRGAYETFLFSSCEVPAGMANTIRVTFTNNVSPPLLPASGATGFTARKNGSSNVVNGAVTRVGDNILEITLTDAYVAGNTADISWSSGTLTDSTLIGGSVNQPYVGTLTNQSCTNNIAGVAFTYTQARYELHGAYGSEASPVILPHGFASTGAAENFLNYTVVAGGKLRLRFAVTCGGSDCPPTGFYLYASRNGGGYAVVPDTIGANLLALCGTLSGNPDNATATTDQLSTAGTFAPGGYVATSNAVPTISGLNNGYKTELEYCVKFSSSASTGGYDFRLYKQDGTALDTYTVTPHLDMLPMAAGGSGF